MKDFDPINTFVLKHVCSYRGTEKKYNFVCSVLVRMSKNVRIQTLTPRVQLLSKISIIEKSYCLSRLIKDSANTGVRFVINYGRRILKIVAT